MNIIKNQSFDEERALYGSDGIVVAGCRFDGPADGESALKESRNIEVKDSFFNLRYPFWHDDNLKISGCELTENCRAALWYTENAEIKDTRLHGIKALRECSDIRIENCDIISPEFGWSVRGIFMKDTAVVSAGVTMLRYMQISSLLVGGTLVSTCMCQAVGNARGALILSLSRQGILFVAAIYMLHGLVGFNGILAAQPVADLLTGIIALIIVFRILGSEESLKI